jgi:hypothetical protein
MTSAPCVAFSWELLPAARPAPTPAPLAADGCRLRRVGGRCCGNG